ncbi:MAG: ribose-5-phosphate isomerase RpiA [Planctomycetota bacterium]
MSEAKRAAGERAADLVTEGMVVGLGTGTTVRYALERLAERIRREGLAVRGVPTSRDTAARARALGIPLATLAGLPGIDLTIDGADEIDPAFDMIKGGGGALLREKVVAAISRREVIVADRAKLVARLGVGVPLPVEVVPFARPAVARRIAALGATPAVRRGPTGGIYRTDNGNHILDCRFSGGIAGAAALERELARIPGLVESGLFVGLAHTLVVGEADGRTEVRERR